MNRTELFDKILKHIYENPDNFWIINSWCEIEFGIKDRKLIESIVDEMIEKDWVLPKKDNKYSLMINYNGQQLIVNYGSYSSFLNDLNKSDKKTKTQNKTDRALNNISRISAILFGVTSFILSYNKFFIDDVKIEKQETEIEKLNKTIDTLKIKLKKQHTTAV